MKRKTSIVKKAQFCFLDTRKGDTMKVSEGQHMIYFRMSLCLGLQEPGYRQWHQYYSILPTTVTHFLPNLGQALN